GYEQYDFDVPVGTRGDAYDRYLVRLEEIRQSARIVMQAVDKIPAGPILADEPKFVLPEKTRVLTGMEELIHQFMLVTGEMPPPRRRRRGPAPLPPQPPAPPPKCPASGSWRRPCRAAPSRSRSCPRRSRRWRRTFRRRSSRPSART